MSAINLQMLGIWPYVLLQRYIAPAKLFLPISFRRCKALDPFYFVFLQEKPFSSVVLGLFGELSRNRKLIRNSESTFGK
jgi:hypothetical protein